MGTLKKLDAEKADLNRTLKMLESLSRDHRIDISARIDAYYRDEMIKKSDEKQSRKRKKPAEKELELV